jgi:hypothetical protein
MVGQLVCSTELLFFLFFVKQNPSKLNIPQYGGLAINGCHLIWFLDCNFDETGIPGTGPIIDEELAEQWPEADLIQASVYLGYVKRHRIKVLIVLFLNEITGYLYGPISGHENNIAALNIHPTKNMNNHEPL